MGPLGKGSQVCGRPRSQHWSGGRISSNPVREAAQLDGCALQVDRTVITSTLEVQYDDNKRSLHWMYTHHLVTKFSEVMYLGLDVWHTWY
jgi:hypothetical protein